MMIMHKDADTHLRAGRHCQEIWQDFAQMGVFSASLTLGLLQA
jgi:hypothetical protein